MNDFKNKFNINYDRGMYEFENGNFEVSIYYLKQAIDNMLHLIDESSGDLKRSRVQCVEVIYAFIDKIKIKNVDLEISGSSRQNLDKVLMKLSSLEGLSKVKEQVKSLISQININNQRRMNGLPTINISNHMVFSGNPGTGKTTVGRIMGEIFKELGILSTGNFVEVDRGSLIGGYIGHSEEKTIKKIQEAKGGVLFIDEAHTLNKDSNNDYGLDVINILVKYMEDYRNDLVVIVAGYSDSMKEFIDSNPGLKSRFKHYIEFEDYSPVECLNILTKICSENEHLIDNDAQSLLLKYIEDEHNERGSDFGNARFVRNLYENLFENHSRRLSNKDFITREDLTTFRKEDLPYNYTNSAGENIEYDIFPSYSPINSKFDSKILETKMENSNQKYDSEKKVLDSKFSSDMLEYKFDWDTLPSIGFNDIAGLDSVKETVLNKVLLPLKCPEAFEGYNTASGGGLFLYGPPGTGKTMVAAAIANEIGAKFCSVKPSDLLQQGVGNTEKAIKCLFQQARKHSCSIIYFDEVDCLFSKTTKSQVARQLRSELLSQLQGIDSYNKNNKDNMLFLIAATNKPWEVDSAFLRPGRFGIKVYVNLPDSTARNYLIEKHITDITKKNIVEIRGDIDICFSIK